MLSGPTKNIAYLLLTFVLIVSCFVVVSAQLPSQDPGHKEDAEVVGVKFSVPNSFNLEESSDSRVAFMRHKKYDLALFVAVPEKQVDDNYLTSLSNTLTSQLFPKEKDFRWKLLPSDSDKKVSKFQVASGNTKGFNGERLFQTDYITVKVKDREILVGYITQLGQFSDNAKYLFNLKGFNGERLFQTDYIAVEVKDREILVGYITQLGQFSDNAKYLFNLKGVGGMSMPGWYAQAHILASVTGEKYEEINPGTVIRATPVKKN